MDNKKFSSEIIAKQIADSVIEHDYDDEQIDNLIEVLEKYTPKTKMKDDMILVTRFGILSAAFYINKTDSTEEKLGVLFDSLELPTVNKNSKELKSLLEYLVEFAAYY